MKSRSDSAFVQLVAIMHRLRAPGGCPWDAEQTHKSLAPYLIEEAYEVLDALENGDDAELCDELGDVLLQVVFHAELAAERGAFTIDEVAGAITSKLVRRHPHVFADVEVASSSEVVANWARIKEEEKRSKAAANSGVSPGGTLDSVPRAMPALLRAHRLGAKAGAWGLDWKDTPGVRDKITEELAELDEAVAADDKETMLAELGDLVFAAVSYIRHLGGNAETVLHDTLDRFQSRFASVERDMAASGLSPGDASAEEIDERWRAAKR